MEQKPKNHDALDSIPYTRIGQATQLGNKYTLAEKYDDNKITILQTQNTLVILHQPPLKKFSGSHALPSPDCLKTILIGQLT